jgi:hypothetical protein
LLGTEARRYYSEDTKSQLCKVTCCAAEGLELAVLHHRLTKSAKRVGHVLSALSLTQ